MVSVVGQESVESVQAGLFGIEESPSYLSEQLITYIGNKRSLLGLVGLALARVKGRLGTRRVAIADLFSGSGVVARYFKQHAERLVVNDLEKYCEVISRCYLANRSEIDLPLLRSLYNEFSEQMRRGPLLPGIVTENYAPMDDKCIAQGERVFYTNRNARYIDTARKLIGGLPRAFEHFLLAPLLSEASIHANTSGVFKGFYKDKSTGIGKFGGNHEDALLRITGDISVPFPVFSNFECPVRIYRADANDLARSIEEVDVVYLDPPYNQHPYGSNYFMLNLIVDNVAPGASSRVSGIPDNWNRSAYNKRSLALPAFRELIAELRTKFVIASFNSEGFISREQMLEQLESLGKVEILEADYNTFRGSRNLANRNKHLKEYVYLVELR